MQEELIPYGPRRFALQLIFFAGGGVGFVWWSRTVDGPTYVFPFGRLDATSASLVLLLVGAGALLHASVTSYVRFVRRPVVALRDGEISIPLGEFAGGMLVLRPGDVLDVREDGPRRGGWRTCHVRHRRGAMALHSSRLPSDDAFFKVRDALRALGKRTVAEPAVADTRDDYDERLEKELRALDDHDHD